MQKLDDIATYESTVARLANDDESYASRLVRLQASLRRLVAYQERNEKLQEPAIVTQRLHSHEKTQLPPLEGEMRPREEPAIFTRRLNTLENIKMPFRDEEMKIEKSRPNVELEAVGRGDVDGKTPIGGSIFDQSFDMWGGEGLGMPFLYDGSVAKSLEDTCNVVGNIGSIEGDNDEEEDLGDTVVYRPSFSRLSGGFHYGSLFGAMESNFRVDTFGLQLEGLRSGNSNSLSSLNSLCDTGGENDLASGFPTANGSRRSSANLTPPPGFSILPPPPGFSARDASPVLFQYDIPASSGGSTSPGFER